jgi:hypothetical protein
MPYRAEKTGSLTQTMIPGTTAADTFQLTPSKGEIGTLKPTTPDDQGSLFEAGQREMWNAKAATLPDPAVKAMVENAGLRYDGKANGTHQFTIVSDKTDGAHKITWNIGKNQSLNDSIDELNKVWRKELGRDITLPFVRPSEQKAQESVVEERKKTPAEVRDEQLAFGFYENAVVEMKDRAPKAKTLSGLPLKQDVVTIGNAFSITADIEKNKATDFRGRKLAGTEDVAVAAGLIRDPRCETVLCLYMKGDTVVGNFAVTSGAASYVNLGLSTELVDQMNNEMAALKADSYYIVHNHPSGHVNPSGSQGLGNDRGDIGFTKNVASAVKGFKAHVIIDHGVYSELSIGKDGMVKTRESIKMPEIRNTPDPLKQGAKPHPVLWQGITGPGDAALLMKNVGENPSGYITAIYTDAMGFVTGIQHISTNAFVGPLDKVVDLLKRQSFAFGTPGGPILYGEAPFAGGYANNRYQELIRNGSIVDMVYSGTLTSTGFGPEAYSLKREKGTRKVAGMGFGRVTANVGIKEVAAYTGVKRDELMKALGDNLLENERITSEVLEGQPFLQESEYSTTLTPAAQRAFPALSNTWIDKAIGTLQNWKDVNKNVRDGDISNFRRTMQQPLMMRDKYPLVGQAQDIELSRQQARSSLQIKLTGDYERNTVDTPVQNPIMDLSDDEEKIFRKIALESTTGGTEKEGIVFEDAEVQAKARALGADQTQAANIAQTYAAVKVGYDQAMKVRSEHMEKMLYFPYQGETWADDLKELAGAKEADLKDVMDRLDIANKYSPKEQERLLRAVATIREPFNLIKQYRREMGRIKYYVPLEHGRGEFVVRVWDKNEEGEEMALWSYRTETKAQAAAVMDKLQRDPEYMDLRGKRMSVEIEKGTPESLYQRVYDDNLYRFMLIGMERMKAGETYSDDEINGFIKNLSQALSDELKARGFGARMIQRRSPDVKGFELKDQRQAFLDYMSGLAGVVTKQEAAAKYQALLKEIPKNMPNLYDFVAGYSKDMLRNPDRLDRSIDKLKMLATLQYIAGNLRLPLVQITQNFVLSVPEMSRQLKRAGFGTAASLGQAHTRIVGAAWDIARGKLNAEEAHHLALMTNQGVTEAKFLQEIYGRMQNKWAGGFSKMFDYVMYPFMWLERLNRQTAFLAMHRLGVEQAKRQGIEITDEKMQAINQKAVRFVFDTQVMYGKANQPEPMRGAGVSNRLLSLAYTFKQYPHHYLAYMKEAIKEGHGHAIGRMGDDIAKLSMSPALVYQLPKMMLTYMKNALTAPGYDAVMLSLAWMSAFGGVLAWPFVDDILELYERMTGNPVRAKMKRVVHSGVPTMIDMDITNSLKIGAPWTVGTNFGDQLSQSALGVYAGLATNYGKAFSQMWAGNFGRGLEYASPTMIQYPLKAFREYTEGATTGKGKTVYDAEGKPKKLDPWQTFLQAGGIKSAEMGEINRDYRTFSMMTAHYTQERTKIFEDTRRALKDQDAAGLEKARADMEKYNAEVANMGGSIAPINQASLKTALRERPGKRELAFGRLMNTPE